jgi:hypothetical protein
VKTLQNDNASEAESVEKKRVCSSRLGEWKHAYLFTQSHRGDENDLIITARVVHITEF